MRLLCGTGFEDLLAPAFSKCQTRSRLEPLAGKTNAKRNEDGAHRLVHPCHESLGLAQPVGHGARKADQNEVCEDGYNVTCDSEQEQLLGDTEFLVRNVYELWQERQEEDGDLGIEHITPEALPEYCASAHTRGRAALNIQSRAFARQCSIPYPYEIASARPLQGCECYGGCSQNRGKSDDRSEYMNIGAGIDAGGRQEARYSPLRDSSRQHVSHVGAWRDDEDKGGTNEHEVGVQVDHESCLWACADGSAA